MSIPNVLSIAGSDPGGGAGIQGDLKTMLALGVHGCAVPVALTAQGTRGVDAVLPVPAAFVTRQLDVLLDDVEVHAVKVGMLGSARIVHAVADVLERRRPPHLVLDPVLRASAGGRLLDGAGLAALRRRLLPLATVVTPNADEAGALLGVRAPRTIAEARTAAERVRALGAHAVLLTGGHLDTGGECVDVLCDAAGTRELRAPRVTGGTHGTGCALSTAIAALLARGCDLDAACAAAQRFVGAAVRGGAALRVGSGAAPVYPPMEGRW